MSLYDKLGSFYNTTWSILIEVVPHVSNNNMDATIDNEEGEITKCAIKRRVDVTNQC